MATQEKVKLYGTWASPFGRRVELALKIKGIQYDYIEEDLKNKSPELLQYNPIFQKIPVLVHNSKPISESGIILEYIDEVWKNNPLLPQDPFDRATARFWAKFVNDKVYYSAIEVTTSDGEAKEKAFEEFIRVLELIQNELKGKEYFGGESIGYLDIMVFFVVYFFQTCQEIAGIEFHKEERTQSLQKWIEKMVEVDVVKECIPPRDKHLAYVRSSIEHMRSNNLK